MKDEAKRRLSSRKFMVSLILLTIATTALFYESNGSSIATFDEWSSFAIWLSGFYFAANKFHLLAGAVKKIKLNDDEANR